MCIYSHLVCDFILIYAQHLRLQNWKFRQIVCQFWFPNKRALETRIKETVLFAIFVWKRLKILWIVPLKYCASISLTVTWRNLLDCRWWCFVHIEMIFSQRKVNRERLNPTNRTRNAPVKFFNVSGLSWLSVGGALYPV